MTRHSLILHLAWMDWSLVVAVCTASWAGYTRDARRVGFWVLWFVMTLALLSYHWGRDALLGAW